VLQNDQAERCDLRCSELNTMVLDGREGTGKTGVPFYHGRDGMVQPLLH